MIVLSTGLLINPAMVIAGQWTVVDGKRVYQLYMLSFPDGLTLTFTEADAGRVIAALRNRKAGEDGKLI